MGYPALRRPSQADSQLPSRPPQTPGRVVPFPMRPGNRTPAVPRIGPGFAGTRPRVPSFGRRAAGLARALPYLGRAARIAARLTPYGRAASIAWDVWDAVNGFDNLPRVWPGAFGYVLGACNAGDGFIQPTISSICGNSYFIGSLDPILSTYRGVLGEWQNYNPSSQFARYVKRWDPVTGQVQHYRGQPKPLADPRGRPTTRPATVKRPYPTMPSWAAGPTNANPPGARPEPPRPIPYPWNPTWNPPGRVRGPVTWSPNPFVDPVNVVITVTGPRGRPTTTVSVGKPSPRRPPRPDEPEQKSKGRKMAAAIFGALAAYSEASDLVDVLMEGVDAATKRSMYKQAKGRAVTPWDKIRAIHDSVKRGKFRWDKIPLAWLENELEDQLVGRAIGGAQKGWQHFGQTDDLYDPKFYDLMRATD